MIGTIAIGATTMFCQKITFHERYSVNQPAIDSATDGESVVMQAYIAMPHTRCCSGVKRNTAPSSSGSSAPAPRPCRKRNRIMNGYVGTVPRAIALTVVSRMLATNMRRGEKMSVAKAPRHDGDAADRECGCHPAAQTHIEANAATQIGDAEGGQARVQKRHHACDQGAEQAEHQPARQRRRAGQR
jgi:hypothetical protein